MHQSVNRERLVYLAHASEDKAVARPLAEGLTRRGIKVWYDNWEIGYGDSLRRRMEKGLGDCTRFVVLLTETSIRKPWVNEEIDAGLMSADRGHSQVIGLRHELPLSSVSPFLKNSADARIQPRRGGPGSAGRRNLQGSAGSGLMGDAPRVRAIASSPAPLGRDSARVVAEFCVRKSAHAQSMDPQVTYADIQQETGLPLPDVRIGVLDLIGAGLLEKRRVHGG